MVAAALAPWQDPAVNSQNRLPARELVVPCETEDLAIAIARGEKPKVESRWVIDLDGEWDFKWKREPSRDWEKSGKIKVPSCWQLQGDYDPPLYVNSDYPIAFDGSGDPIEYNFGVVERNQRDISGQATQAVQLTGEVGFTIYVQFRDIGYNVDNDGEEITSFVGSKFIFAMDGTDPFTS